MTSLAGWEAHGGGSCKDFTEPKQDSSNFAKEPIPQLDPVSVHSCNYQNLRSPVYGSRYCQRHKQA
jgi:hypothetical protein